MKTPDIARAAEQLLAGAGWLPAMLRTPQPEGEQRAAVETEMVVLQELAVLRKPGAVRAVWQERSRAAGSPAAMQIPCEAAQPDQGTRSYASRRRSSV